MSDKYLMSDKYSDKYTVWKKVVILLGLIVVFAFSGCGKTSAPKKISGASDLNSREYIIGGETGTIALSSAKKAFPNARFVEFTAPGDIYTALSGGRITAMVYDRPSLEYANLKRPDLLLLPEELAVGHISVVAPSKNRELMEKVNAFIRQYRADGTYREMYDRWVKSKDSVMPEIPMPSHPDGTIVIGSDCTNEPMGFIGPNGAILGFDMEFVKRLALFLNLKYEVKIMEYQALFPACASGKIDLAVAQMDATPERKETLLFSDPYIDSPVAVMIRQADYGESTDSWQSFNNSGRVIGVWQGTTAMTVVEQKLPNAKIQYFNTTPLEALKSGRIDAFAFDSFYLNYVEKRNPDFTVFPGTLAPEQIVVATAKKNTELLANVNRFIRQYRSDGTYQEMHKRWFDTEHEPDLPEIPLPSSPVKTLTIGIAAETEPACFIGKKGKPTGFDIEFAMRLGLFLNRNVRFEQMSYDALIASGTSGKIDLVIATLNATPERRESLAMSDPYLDSEVVLLVRKDEGPVSNGEIRSVADLKGKRASVKTGSVTQELTERHVSGVEYFSYTDHPTAVQALLAGKVDAALADGPVLRIWAERYPDKLRLADIYEKARYGFAFKKGSPLTAKVNECLLHLKNSGELKKITSKWCESNPDGKKLEKWTHRTDFDGSAGTLRYASDPTKEPMCHLGPDGHYAGLDVELVSRIAYDLNMKLDFVPMNFGALLESVMSGKVDVASGGMYITPEREEKVDFSIPYYEGGLAILTRTIKKTPETSSTIINSLADLQGKKAASLTGAEFQRLTEPLQAGISYIFFNDNNSSVQALRTEKVDAVLLDEPVAQLYAAKFSDELRFVGVYAEDFYGYAFAKGSPLTAQATVVIQKLKQSGELQKLIDKWCKGSSAAKTLENWNHKKDYTGKNGKLRFASDPVLEPMCYIGSDGKATGLDVELGRRIAYELNMEFEFVPVTFGALIEALSAGRVDIVGDALSITEERKSKVDFAECYYTGGLSILARREKKDAPATEISSLSQLAGHKVGIMTGTTNDMLTKKYMPQSLPVYFNMFNDLVAALESGKIDAFLMEEPQARILLRSRTGLNSLKEKVTDNDYGFFFSRQSQSLRDAFSDEIKQMKADGTLQKLERKWFVADEAEQIMPNPHSGEKGTLKFATVPQFEPFSFVRDGQIVGFDIEVAMLVAEKLGYSIQILPMEFGGFIEAIVSGKADMGGGCITITEERKQQVLFTEPNYLGGIVAIVRKETGNSTPGFRDWLSNTGKELAASFDRTFLRESRWKLILQGLKITLLITVLAALLGTILAFPVCMMRRSRFWLWRMFSKCYISLMQGTPILVILMILYYVVFAKIDIDAVLVAVIGFGLNFSAYVAEMLRTGIEGIPKGQSEAALALGFSRFAVFRNVILPQAVRSILPVYRGEFINVLKTTSIVGYIAIQDLTKMSDIIRSRTYEAFFPLIATAVIYFVAAWLLAMGLSLLEYKLNPNRRRKHRKEGDTK